MKGETYTYVTCGLLAGDLRHEAHPQRKNILKFMALLPLHTSLGKRGISRLISYAWTASRIRPKKGKDLEPELRSESDSWCGRPEFCFFGKQYRCSRKSLCLHKI